MDSGGWSIRILNRIGKIFYIFVFSIMPGMTLCGQTVEEPNRSVDKHLVFSDISASASKINTLFSDFIQEKHLGMLNKVLVSKGQFYYKRKERLRWVLTEPAVSGFCVNGKKAKRWDEKTGSTQEFEVHRVPFIKVFTDQVFAWARADFEWLQKRYQIKIISSRPADLELYPLSAREKEYVDHLRIAFARNAGHVSAVEIHEPDGDFTRIRFLNIRINEPLQDSLFN